MNRTSRARPDTTAIGAQHDDAGGAVPPDPGPPNRGAVRPRTTPPTRVEELPPLPAEFDRTVDAGLASLSLELSGTQRRLLADHARLLVAWTRSVNLTAIRDPEAIARLHVLDSLGGVPLLRRLGADRFLDIGSGGGYPGLVLAVATPADARLVDSIGKKATFLETAVAALGLGDRVAIDRRRVEDVAVEPSQRERWPAVTARAVGSLAELVELAFPLLRSGGVLLAWKRDPGAAELGAARRAMRALGGGSLDVHHQGLAALPGHVIVALTKASPTPDGFPRDPARRKRRPW
ncbi:MAG TPA: 16S rRNA (guanine(527)-N(7))-methyltransferase RsmG [Candidatus Limnocylindrales bacterium]|nr:16S rRNA (guanine(527)-N(7))-methyltransferase RsmG [Candidatus Limnocylindrales bacterium]